MEDIEADSHTITGIHEHSVGIGNVILIVNKEAENWIWVGCHNYNDGFPLEPGEGIVLSFAEGSLLKVRAVNKNTSVTYKYLILPPKSDIEFVPA